MKRLTALLLLLITSFPLFSSKIVDVRPLTNRILMVQYDDGYIVYPGYGDERDNSEVYVDELDIKAAIKTEGYTLFSKSDENYRIEQNPLSIGRKTKPTEVSRNWPPIQAHADEHWIYLELPYPMKRGMDYVLEVSVPVEGKKHFEFTFDEFNMRSDAIHVNQVGYMPGSSKKGVRQMPKYAYVSHWMGDAGPLNLEDYRNNLFYVVDVRNNQPVFVGKMVKRKDFETGAPETQHITETPNGQYHASDVYQCEFTTCPSTGTFKIVIEGIGSSYPFKIEKDVYREAFITTCRGLFHERAGIDKVEPWSKWNHKADHNGAKGYPLYYTSFRTMDLKSEGGNLSEVEALEKGRIETWGWYHDAGDWDGYPSHMVIPSYLMTTYELAPDNFSDGELNIPESGNGIPDILDEASWLLKYYKRTRELVMEKGYGTGGIAGARVHGDFWKKPSMLPSWEDDRKWYVFGEESRSSFRYAGHAAQLAYCLNMAGFPDSANVWKNEALELFDWADKNTRPGDNIGNDRFFASAWIYKLTGEERFHEEFKKLNPVKGTRTELPGDKNYASWGVFAYATMEETRADKELYDHLRSECLWWADTSNVEPSGIRAFRYGITMGHPMVVGHATTPKVLPCMIAYEISNDPKYLETMVFTSDYMLGGNPLNMCWVTGLGTRSPKEILHIDSWVDGVDEPIEGQVPYGPNREGNRGGPGFNGPWDSDYLRSIVYPDDDVWPGHELWSNNRWCPITNEYTVHQNICVAAAIYGYLCDKK